MHISNLMYKAFHYGQYFTIDREYVEISLSACY